MLDPMEFPYECVHKGHTVVRLAITRCGLYPFYCLTCNRPFGVLAKPGEINSTTTKVELTHKVPDKCPGCGAEIARWEVCEPELCEECHEKQKEQIIKDNTHVPNG